MEVIHTVEVFGEPVRLEQVCLKVGTIARYIAHRKLCASFITFNRECMHQWQAVQKKTKKTKQDLKDLNTANSQCFLNLHKYSNL